MHLFYHDLQKNTELRLENEEHHHCIHVLRHKVGDKVHATDGKGKIATIRINDIEKEFTGFEIIEIEEVSTKPFRTHIAIGPTKKLDRMEWFVEKACEMGVDEITFIKTQNSERPRIRLDRLEKKALSALKQSKSGWKTVINPITDFQTFIASCKENCKFIAAVGPDSHYLSRLIKPCSSIAVLIGPEGDFTDEELQKATDNDFKVVGLGRHILRTETAGLVSIQMINTINEY